MRLAMLRSIAVLAVLSQSVPALGQDEAKPKKTPFAEMCESLLGGAAMQLVDSWFLPHTQSFPRLKLDTTDEYLKRIKAFPDDLARILKDPSSPDHAAALQYVDTYVRAARGHAAHLPGKDVSPADLATAAEWAVAPNGDAVRKAHAERLKSKTPEIRLISALALASLDEKQAAANVELAATADSGDGPRLAAACNCVGLAHLTGPPALRILKAALKHRDAEVRQAAAGAIITIGGPARELTPDLIAYLRTGKEAEGAYQYPFAMMIPQQANLALMALASIGKDAARAAPAIVERYPQASDADKVAMLRCLARLGNKEPGVVAVLRRALDSDAPTQRLTAACALLHLIADDRDATAALKKAFGDPASVKVALEACWEVGAPSREIAGEAAKSLAADREDRRRLAMQALGSIGRPAAAAIPALEELLAREHSGLEHTFQSSQTAARALADIGGKDAAAALLRVADSKSDGARYAFMYLPDVADDLPPTSLDVLVRAMNDHLDAKDAAAIALSNLGPRSSRVRRDLERKLDDPAVGWIVDTALRRIDAARQ
jgi:hypothetical protein